MTLWGIFVFLMVGLLSLPVQAAIVWEGEYHQFRFAVDKNGGTFKSPTFFNEVNNVDSSTNLGGSAGSYAAKIETTTDPIGVIEMKAGAWGNESLTSPADGLVVNAYSEINLAGFDNAIHGVNVGQNIVSWVSRNFSADTGTYTFNAELAGSVAFNSFEAPGFPPYFSDYSVSAVVSLDEFKDKPVGPDEFVRNVAEFELDGTPDGSTPVDLLASLDGFDVFYQLRVVLDIQTDLANALLETIRDPNGLPAFEGPFSIGSAGSPMVLSASVLEDGSGPGGDPVPIPGSVVLLFSGISGLAVIRRRMRRR
jgi:hypothetical protein